MTLATPPNTSSQPLTVEAIKLHLVRNQAFLSGQPGKSFVFSAEAIRNMVKALEFADSGLTTEIETFLVKTGKEALPEVVKGLLAENTNVKSTCAMVLIRMGALAIPAVQTLYQQHAGVERVRWVIEYVMQELGEPVSKAARTTNVVPLGVAV